ASAQVTYSVARGTPILTWSSPANITFGTALGSAQLNATADVPGTFAYSPAAGTVLDVGVAQPLSVTFTPNDTANYNGALTMVNVTVVPATPGVSVSLASYTYDGTAHAATGFAY